MARLKKNKYLVYLSGVGLPNVHFLSPVEPIEKKKNAMAKKRVTVSLRDISLRVDKKKKKLKKKKVKIIFQGISK